MSERAAQFHPTNKAELTSWGLCTREHQDWQLPESLRTRQSSRRPRMAAKYFQERRRWRSGSGVCFFFFYLWFVKVGGVLQLDFGKTVKLKKKTMLTHFAGNLFQHVQQEHPPHGSVMTGWIESESVPESNDDWSRHEVDNYTGGFIFCSVYVYGPREPFLLCLLSLTMAEGGMNFSSTRSWDLTEDWGWYLPRRMRRAHRETFE